MVKVVTRVFVKCALRDICKVCWGGSYPNFIVREYNDNKRHSFIHLQIEICIYDFLIVGVSNVIKQELCALRTNKTKVLRCIEQKEESY